MHQQWTDGAFAEAPEERADRKTRRAAWGSFLGTTIEWYDFYLYGTVAALVLHHLFFPDFSSSAGLLAAFGTYAVGFGARPVGALLAGHLGDRFGRKRVLVGSLLTMGAATVLIGMLPDFGQVGIVAPVLLVVVRLFQGLAVGGEWGGAALIVVEHASPRRRGFYGSFVQVGSAAGMLLASGGFATVRALVDVESFESWGWRLPFLFSAVLIVVGLLVRLRLEDAPVFARARANQELARRPLVEMFRSHAKPVWLTTCLRMSQIGGYTLYTTFGLAYIERHFGAGTNIGLVGILVSSALSLAGTPLWAVLSDRVGRKPVYLFGAIGAVVSLGVFFLAVESGSAVFVVVSMVLGMNLFQDAMYGPQAAWFAEMFSTRVRFSGVSAGYQFGSVVGGGLTPLIATGLWLTTGGFPYLVLVYFVVLSAATAGAAVRSKETYRMDTLDDGQASNGLVVAPTRLRDRRRSSASR